MSEKSSWRQKYVNNMYAKVAHACACTYLLMCRYTTKRYSCVFTYVFVELLWVIPTWFTDQLSTLFICVSLRAPPTYRQGDTVSIYVCVYMLDSACRRAVNIPSAGQMLCISSMYIHILIATVKSYSLEKHHAEVSPICVHSKWFSCWRIQVLYTIVIDCISRDNIYTI